MILSNPVGQRTTICLLSAERYAELVQGKHDDDENQIYVVRDAGTHHICAVALGQQRRKMVRPPRISQSGGTGYRHASQEEYSEDDAGCRSYDELQLSNARWSIEAGPGRLVSLRSGYRVSLAC
jgi:hypothetical protein